MSDFSRFVPEHVRNLSGYTPGEIAGQAQQSHVNCIKMASNENPFGPSPKAVKDDAASLAESSFPPQTTCDRLRQKLVEHHNVMPEANHSHCRFTASLGIIARTLLAPGLNAVASERSCLSSIRLPRRQREGS